VFDRFVAVPSPGVLNPETVDTSIYSYQDITNFNKMVLFQLEGRSIMKTVAHQAGYGHNAQNNQGLTLDGMISEEIILKTVDGWWKKGTGYLTSFGTFSAGFIGILLFFISPTEEQVSFILKCFGNLYCICISFYFKLFSWFFQNQEDYNKLISSVENYEVGADGILVPV